MSIRLSLVALLLIGLVVVNASKYKKQAATTCAPGSFVCKNGTCLKNAWVCDTENDCGDGSDEVGCATDCTGQHQFKCTNTMCIPKLFKCDGDDDCGDKSDETNCSH